VLVRDLRPGEILSEADLTVQRPGTGIPAGEVQRAVGQRAVRAMTAGEMLRWEMLTSAA
jgi:sialic acid synthase SpsE